MVVAIVVVVPAGVAVVVTVVVAAVALAVEVGNSALLAQSFPSLFILLPTILLLVAAAIVEVGPRSQPYATNYYNSIPTLVVLLE